MLSGYQPFYAMYVGELIDMIKKGEFDFVGPAWDLVSDNAKDLIIKMLQTDPSQRATVHVALAHPWFTQIHNSADVTFPDHTFRSNLMRNQRRLTRNFYPSLELSKRVSDASTLQRLSAWSNLYVTGVSNKCLLDKY